MKNQLYIGLYYTYTKYCNYSTTAMNTIILHMIFHVVHIDLVLTCGCHVSLSIDFRREEGHSNGHPPAALTHGDIANDHNAPMLSLVKFFLYEYGNTMSTNS